MKGSGFAAEDMIALARRGSLTDVDARRLKIAIGASCENRLLYEAGKGFDAEDFTMPGDEVLVLRVADHISKCSELPTRRRAKSPIVLAVAGLLVASVAAAAGWVIESHHITADQSKEEREQPQELQQVKTRARGGKSSPMATAPTSEAGSEGAPAVASEGSSSPKVRKDAATSGIRAREVHSQVPAQEIARSTRTVDREGAQGQNAATLFAEGNRARRSGNIVLAIETYKLLTELFPKAKESQQAKLIVAELELQRSHYAEALEYFRESQRGSMAEEAVWGMARAYRGISDTDREREMLEALATQFPHSAYAEAARHRLDELQ